MVANVDNSFHCHRTKRVHFSGVAPLFDHNHPSDSYCTATRLQTNYVSLAANEIRATAEVGKEVMDEPVSKRRKVSSGVSRVITASMLGWSSILDYGLGSVLQNGRNRC